MTAADAFILGALAGQVMVLVAQPVGRLLAQRLLERVTAEATPEEPEVPATQEATAQAVEQASPSALDRDPFDMLPTLAALDLEVTLPVVADGVLLGSAHLDPRGGRPARREFIAGTPAPEDPHA